MNCQEIKRLAEENFDFAVQTRRRFHAHPELSNQEHETTQYIIDQLEQLGIPYIRPAETGVIAVIRGKQPGKVLGIRADIDALPIQEETELPFASQVPGVSHACGHDIHTAALRFRQRIERNTQMAEQLHAFQQLLRGGLRNTGGVFDSILTVEGILRLVADEPPLIGGLVQFVCPELVSHFLGNL